MRKCLPTKGCCFRVFSPLPADRLWNQEEKGRGGHQGLVVLVFWKVRVPINCTPATCILASFREIQSFWSQWIYWGFIMQLLRSLLSACKGGWIRWFGMCGAGSAVVSGWDLFTVQSDCSSPPHWSIDTSTATEGSCCTTHTQNRL